MLPNTLKLSALSLAILLAACGNESSSPVVTNPGTSTETAGSNQAAKVLSVKDTAAATGHEAASKNVTISTVSGINVAMTIHYPKLAAGEPTPLLVHSHGFGGNRVQSLDFEEAEQTSEIGIDALQIAYNQKTPVEGRTGWYVISYDQAGHGDSGGNVNVMDPTVEGEMLKAVLDWAEANLTNLAYSSQGAELNPVIGTIGRSYGGAFQLMAAGIDNRVDAMVPGGTWYDLRYSLNPGGVPKTTYLNGLVLSGMQSIQGRFEPFLYQELIAANTTNEVSEPTVRRLGSNGSVSYCSNIDFGDFNRDMTLRSDVPALFVQGLQDVLFNINEAIDNFACYKAVNPNTKQIFVKYGHHLDSLGMQADPRPGLQSVGAKYAFNESKLWIASAAKDCPASLYDEATGRCVVELKNVMFQFLAENLLGSAKAKNTAYLGFEPFTLPDTMSVLDNGEADPTSIAINESVIDTAGEFSEPTAPTDMFEQATGITGVFSGLSSTQLAQLAQPVFKPLSNGSDTGCYVGTPRAIVTVAPGAIPAESPDAPIVFVGLGIQRADGSTSVLHDQITPVKGYGTVEIDLPGIGVNLREGESLQFTIQGYNPIFMTSFNRIPAPVSVTAQVALPAKVTDATGLCSK